MTVSMRIDEWCVLSDEWLGCLKKCELVNIRNMSKFDYIIIGGGIIGMMTARELAVRGAKTAIFERKTLGDEASMAAGGILSSMRPWAESSSSMMLSEQGKKLYPNYVESLKRETGIDSEYIQSGLIISDETHASKTKVWAEKGLIKLAKLESSKSINLPEYSILLPEIAQVRPPKLISALRKSLEDLNVSFFENTEITNIVIKNNEFQRVEFNGGKEQAGAVIITAGAWSNSLLNKFCEEIKIKPIRGQIVCLKFKQQILQQIILDGPHYLIPRKDGHVLIGSTMEDVGFVNETTKIARKELLDWAKSILPSLDEAMPVSHWSGLRPSTDMNLPFIGKLMDYSNIYLNTGHFRKGILQGPSSAQLLVESLLGKTSFMDINKFNLEQMKSEQETV
jgi:glycine oxidase